MASDSPYPEQSQQTQVAYLDGAPDSVHLRRAKLVVNPGSDDESTQVFDENAISIGTLEDNDVVLDDDTVSRRHCRILQEDDHYVIVDLDSTNGTQINGVRLREAFLAPHTVFSVGNTDIRFCPVDERMPVEPSQTERLGDIVGRSVAMREIFDIIEKIAPTSATVVIEGETGTGKEVVAQTLHDLSQRSDEPFVVFDCGAVPENLVESELFGHEKGSFTGAVMSRKGLFEMAEGGTIFLDELGELSLELQPKLLRVLEQREVRRVGSNEPIPIDVRVIAATNRSLEDEVNEGRFRQDLFYRLSVVRLFLPALRERLEDIPLLAEHFLDTMDCNVDNNGQTKLHALSAPALEALQQYEWPGNVRELANVIERACSFAETDRLRFDDLPAYITNQNGNGNSFLADDPDDQWTNVPAKSRLQEEPFKQAKQEWISSFEQDYIAELLERHGGNISQSAREADIDRKYFRKLMKKHEIDPDEF